MPAQAQPEKYEIDTYLVAHEEGWQFNFSREEWRKILDAVHDGCSFPSHFSAMILLREINNYLNTISSYRSPSRSHAAWRRVARSLRRARASIVAADPEDTFGPFLKILDKWQRSAELWSSVGGKAPNPRTALFEVILDCWFEAGGPIRRSRDAHTGQLCGA
jgi:hypothetical protein